MIRISTIICLNSASSADSVRSYYVCSVRGTEDLTFTAFHIGRQVLFVTGQREILSVSLVAINRKKCTQSLDNFPIPFYTTYVISSFHHHQPQIYNITVYKIDRGRLVRVMSTG